MHSSNRCKSVNLVHVTPSTTPAELEQDQEMLHLVSLIRMV
jgi:hypothetical protein